MRQRGRNVNPRASLEPMPTIARAIATLRTRGPLHLLRSLRRALARNLSRLGDRGFDRRFGTETRGVVENAALAGVTGPNLAHGIRYEPTRAQPLRQLLRAAAIPAAGTFVDLGCGKGRVLMLAAEHGFARVTGVDHSRALCETARRNLQALRARTGLHFEASVQAQDAGAYAFAPDDSVVFLFNPFDDAVLRPVLANLRASLASHPRELWLVYHRPVWRRVIEEAGGFEPARNFSFGGCEFAVYRARRAG